MGFSKNRVYGVYPVSQLPLVGNPSLDFEDEAVFDQDFIKVDAGLLQLLGVVNKMGEGFSWALLEQLDEHEEPNTDRKLLFMMECNGKLSMALSMLSERLMPFVDFRTSMDMISHAVYNGGCVLSWLLPRVV